MGVLAYLPSSGLLMSSSNLHLLETAVRTQQRKKKRQNNWKADKVLMVLTFFLPSGLSSQTDVFRGNARSWLQTPNFTGKLPCYFPKSSLCSLWLFSKRSLTIWGCNGSSWGNEVMWFLCMCAPRCCLYNIMMCTLKTTQLHTLTHVCPKHAPG